MPAEFKTGLFGCFSDPKLCILTFCLPCYTIGKNAETAFGEECLLIGLLMCAGISTGPILRWRLREKEGLQGSMITDVLIHMFLPCCALIQEAKQVGWNLPDAVANAGKGNNQPTQDMDRQ